MVVSAIMLLGGGWLAKYGFTNTDVTKWVTDGATFAGIFITWWVAHNQHGKIPSLPPIVKLLIATAILSTFVFSSTGCAYLNSTTRHETRTYYHQGTNTVAVVIETTHGRAWTFMDATSTLTRFRNQSSSSTIGTNTYAPGTFASGINESSSGSNAVNIATAVITAAVNAAITASK